ncbi:BrnA antitoxin family protein [Moraxella nasovis]|uniref:BrnA antitoxin family protein n=1 Tax=Moraxella nasovis TaxID=2904121 RepID=UPI001F61F9CC|nr:BrnA antitoxin family protein [Moraxella nasovis]UNU73640.1 BrnA antitoxin family protein [Moraxella nasovis]
MAIVRMTLDQIAQTALNHDELERLKALKDGDIDYSDIPPLTDEQIAHFKPTKQQVTMRLDSDVLAWLKKDGKGYQTKANRLLRALMLQDLHT